MIRLELPYDNRLIPGTAYWLSDLAEKYGVSHKHAASLCFVVETVLEMRAKEPCDGPPVFTLTLEERSDSVIVSITDKGLPYVLTEKQKEMLRNGLVSSFTFEQLAIDGQRLRFIVEKESDARTAPPAPETAEETLLDTDISCRLTGTDDEDILRVIRVMFSSYGFRYIHQDIYHHDHFREALLSGKYISFLAGNAHGQTVGHAALVENDWFPGIPEVCNLVVRDIARGLKVSGRLVAAALEVGTTKNFEGVFAVPVVHHPISQKLFNRQGFTPSGFYFHLAPANLLDPEKDDGIRLDVAYCIRILNKEKKHLLFLPAECADFVRGVFETEEAACEIRTETENLSSGTEHPLSDTENPPSETGTLQPKTESSSSEAENLQPKTESSSSEAENLQPETENPPSETAISWYIDTVNGLLAIRVDKVGLDFSENLEARGLQEDFDVAEAVMVYLNMNDPGCPAAYRYFREHGYIFTGCLPCSLSGDYLLLQHLKGAPIVQENMVLEPNYREMLERLLELLK